MRIQGMGASLIVPNDWEVLEHDSGRVLAIVERLRSPRKFRTNLVLSVDDETTDDLVGDERRLIAEFPTYQPIHIEPFERTGNRGIHRLAHYITADDVPVTMEQWCAGRYSLTGTVETLRYDDYADLFDEVVGTWSLESATATTDVHGGDED